NLREHQRIDEGRGRERRIASITLVTRYVRLDYLLLGVVEQQLGHPILEGECVKAGLSRPLRFAARRATLDCGEQYEGIIEGRHRITPAADDKRIHVTERVGFDLCNHLTGRVPR